MYVVAVNITFHNSYGCAVKSILWCVFFGKSVAMGFHGYDIRYAASQNKIRYFHELRNLKIPRTTENKETYKCFCVTCKTSTYNRKNTRIFCEEPLFDYKMSSGFSSSLVAYFLRYSVTLS